ncbi:thioredoxin domain-containing protein [Rhabdobacter roseus]|uniref:Thioredoxin n=1 Tax=Rhabdobacter roseus TaxID=1655419 RepID=A0A840TLE2_9BACT|nr:thioredoxin domain-containing protein [Rhabdobacter roseus]MBB5282382.1 thioredoxin [Rhabdobacter roseus]
MAQVPLDIDAFAQKITASASVQVVDVRTWDEFRHGHLPQALHMDYRSSDFMQKIALLDKSKPVYVYCLSGGRSAAAAQKLVAQGFTEVYDMQGGYLKWQAAGKPIDEADAKVTSQNQGMSQEVFRQHIASEQLLLVDFYAPWCAPCVKMLPSMKKLALEYEGKVTIQKIHYDQNQSLAHQLGITEIPVLLLYRKGPLLWRGTGYLSEAELKEVLEKNL